MVVHEEHMAAVVEEHTPEEVVHRASGPVGIHRPKEEVVGEQILPHDTVLDATQPH
jgi:hypothetical protein